MKHFISCCRIVCALPALVLVWGCTDESSAFGGSGERPPAVVELAEVSQGSFDAEMRFVGRLQAESSAELYARTEGPIIAVNAGSGDRVRKGQVLAQVDSAEAEQRAAQARASLRMAQATLEQRRADLEVARTTAERSQKLYDQQLVSASDYDAAQAQSMTAASQVEVAKAQIAQAQANLRGALLQLAQTRIVAPFDGFVGKRHLDLGAYATTNRPVFSVVDLSTIRTTIAIPAVAAAHIEQGQTARVQIDAVPGRVFNGEVSRISSVFDPQTNTVEAEVEISNEDGILKPGMFANVAVAYRTDPTALLVPASAVVRNDREEWIFAAEPAGAGDVLTARRVSVSATQPGSGTDERVAVEPLEGELRPGMKVVVLGQESLRDGARIVSADAVETSQESSR